MSNEEAVELKKVEDNTSDNNETENNEIENDTTKNNETENNNETVIDDKKKVKKGISLRGATEAMTTKLRSENKDLIYGKKVKYPIVLVPSDEYIKKLNATHFWEDKDKAEGNDFKLYSKLVRTLVTLLVPILLLVILKSVNELSLNVFIGIMLLLMYAAYFGAFFFMFFTGLRQGNGLYRIISISSKAPIWSDMTFASHQVLFPYESIGSISEFSAILGGSSNVLLNTTTAYTWVLLMMHYGVELTIHRDVFSWDISDISVCIGVVGLLLIGTFEIGYVHTVQAFIHVLGVFMCGGIFIGYVIQQISIGKPGWWFSIILATIGVFCFFLWKYVRYNTEKEHKKIRAEVIEHGGQNVTAEKFKDIVTRRSVKNVVTEAIMMICIALCLGLWLINYDNVCEYGCCCAPK